MKKLLLTIAAGLSMAFSAPLMASAPADSCLKMIIPNKHEIWGYRNPDSVVVDSCINSPTFGQWYAKGSFNIQLTPNSYPFQWVLTKDEEKNVSEILDAFLPLKNALLNLENKTGKIYLHGIETDTITPRSNPLMKLRFDNLVNIQEMEKFLKDSIPYIKWCGYNSRVNTKEYTDVGNADSNEQVIYPNPVYSSIIIKNLENSCDYEIYNYLGNVIQSGKYLSNTSIDLSTLTNGLYFIKYNNKINSFIKE